MFTHSIVVVHTERKVLNFEFPKDFRKISYLFSIDKIPSMGKALKKVVSAWHSSPC